MSFTSHQLCSPLWNTTRFLQVFCTCQHKVTADKGMFVIKYICIEVALRDVYAKDQLTIGRNLFWFHPCQVFCHKSNAITLSIWPFDTRVPFLFRVGFSISNIIVKQEVILTPRIRWQVLLHLQASSCWMTRFFCQIQRKILRKNKWHIELCQTAWYYNINGCMNE